jgi:IclR family transcriptional regulator, KDG regulon repressor
LATRRDPDIGTAAESTGPAILESVGIVFRLLDELALARRPLGVTELSQVVEEPKPRVYRHLASMKQIGVVEQDPVSEKYRLGSKLVVYGTASAEQFDLRAMADPYLTRLRDSTGQTALLSVATHDSALVVSAVESTRRRAGSCLRTWMTPRSSACYGASCRDSRTGRSSSPRRFLRGSPRFASACTKTPMAN